MEQKNAPLGEMYFIVPERRERFSADSAAVKTVADIHRKRPLDMLFVHEIEQDLFPMAGRYCHTNVIKKIKVETYEGRSELLKKIKDGISRKKTRFACLSYNDFIAQNNDILDELSRETTELGLTTEVRKKY